MEQAPQPAEGGGKPYVVVVHSSRKWQERISTGRQTVAFTERVRGKTNQVQESQVTELIGEQSSVALNVPQCSPKLQTCQLVLVKHVPCVRAQGLPSLSSGVVLLRYCLQFLQILIWWWCARI